MNREEAKKKAEALVARMTLEEKASQLRYDAPAIKRLGIPAYNWWNEGLHGVARAGQATVFPQAIGMAAAFDRKSVAEMAGIVATEGRAKYNAYSVNGDRDIYKGLTFWSPNVNIFRDPRWGRGHETYGEDPYLTKELGVSFVKALQGNGDTMKAAACAKHFAVHSGPEALRHEFDAEASAKDMEETYLPAFEGLVKEAKVEAVMGAYNRTNGEPCCGSPTLQKKLRGEWKFQGHFVSDCWAIRDFHEHHMVTDTVVESAALAINNGCDLNCGNTYLHIMKAYEKGLVTEETITRAAVRLFTTRYLLGLFDGSEYDNISYLEVESPRHLDAAEKAAAKVLFGEISPSGKLPVTFYESLEELPDFTDYSMKGRTYRYMERKAQFPFGYGLTYSKVAVDKAEVKTCGQKINVEVEVQNNGAYDTEDVVQIYVKNIDSKNAIPNPMLAGFQRIFLKAGECRKIEIPIWEKAFTVVDETGKRMEEGKKFEIYAGCSQPDEKSKELTGIMPVKIIWEK